MIATNQANPFFSVFLSSFPISCSSWLSKPALQIHPFSGLHYQSETTTEIGSHTNVFFGPEEEFECPDEDECEIDWDTMPGYSENEEENPNEELHPPASFAKQHQSLEKSRLMFEMSWQV